MGAMAFPITGVSMVYWTICSGAVQRNHQSSASLAFVRGIRRWLADSPHKGPVTRKCFHLMTWYHLKLCTRFCCVLLYPRSSERGYTGIRLAVHPLPQILYWSYMCNSSRIAVQLSRDVPWDRISTGCVHGRRGSLIKRLNYFSLLSPLPLSCGQFFPDRLQTW